MCPNHMSEILHCQLFRTSKEMFGPTFSKISLFGFLSVHNTLRIFSHALSSKTSSFFFSILFTPEESSGVATGGLDSALHRGPKLKEPS